MERFRSMKKHALRLVAVVGCGLLSGCGSQYVTNLTPQTAKRNPSNLYRFTVQCAVNPQKLVPDTFKPLLVIDGQQFPLRQDADMEGLYYYDHELDATRTDAKYYFQVSYEQYRSGTVKSYVRKTPLASFSISGFGNLSLEIDRAPVGSEVRVLGSGFTANNRIRVGDYDAPTELLSENVLSFRVPAVTVGKAYPVSVTVGEAMHFAGNLLIDSGRFTAEPTEISLRVSEKTDFTLRANRPSPSDLYINVTTDIPNSVIMPEVRLATGEDSATVAIEGGEPGKGHLYVSAQGFDELTVPIEVIGEKREGEAANEKSMAPDAGDGNAEKAVRD